MALRTELQEPLVVLNEGLDELATCYQLPLTPLIPRPALMLMGFVASSSYLLEHATWSHINREVERDSDVEVFRRWVLEGGMVSVIEDVRRAKQRADQRIQSNSVLVFGNPPKAKL